MYIVRMHFELVAYVLPRQTKIMKKKSGKHRQDIKHKIT